MLLSETAINISSKTTVLKSSDAFYWPNLNISITNSKPYDEELIHGGGRDLWVTMAIDPSDVCVIINRREINLNLRPNQLAIQSPYAVLGTTRRNESRLLHVFVKKELLSEVLGELFDRDADDLEIMSKLGFDDASMTEILRMMQCSLDEPYEYSTLKMEHLSRALAVDVFSKHLSPRPKSATRFDRRLSALQIREVAGYIHDHLASNISLNDMAKIAGLSRTLFIQCFKVSFGETPHQYLIHARIRQARRLLSKSGMPIVQVALLCGFTDQAHFSRCFLKSAGTTPSNYRRKCQ